MMVDDDPIMLEVVQTYLEEAGYTSFVTTSEPRQAMDLFLQQRPDILLLDLMMPEVSGFDILAQVRAHEELRYTPVIILTAESESATKLKALELGATDLLTKPVDPSELRLRLRNALAFKAYQDRLADFDALTGLPNRRKFHHAVDAALKNTQQSRACALLHVDLDRFKQINDTLGHRVGDKLLCAVAQLLDRTLCDAEATGWPGSREPEFRAALSRIAGNGFAALFCPTCTTSRRSIRREASRAEYSLPWLTLSTSRDTSCSSRPASESPCLPAMVRRPRRCSSTPRWPCTRPNSAVERPVSSSRAT